MKLGPIIAVLLFGLVSYSLAIPATYSAETSVDIDIRDPQRGPGPIGIAVTLAKLISEVISLIRHVVDTDNHKRERFTKTVVSEGRIRWPDFNFVVCHVNHTYQWDGVRGQDWDRSHAEVDILLGGTIGYEIYYARSGVFQLLGDGGYINYAYDGFVLERSADNTTIKFRNPLQ